MPLAKTAYIDESLRVHHGPYLPAAVIVADGDANSHRAGRHRHCFYRGQRRLHSRAENPQHRTQLIATMRPLHRTLSFVARTSKAQFTPGWRSMTVIGLLDPFPDGGGCPAHTAITV